MLELQSCVSSVRIRLFIAINRPASSFGCSSSRAVLDWEWGRADQVGFEWDERLRQIP
jgi:hypothetical protein